ncbi:hypothetical protein AB0M11_27925 [Streptomyces sp. NPDC051987]|uniref:hypothetical protein n=1 Tax=Streptomyces sp. NPDC051987 TaxID=3155808 RepID=UPI00342B0B0F
MTVTTTANALIQLHADPPLRGRVLSVCFLVLLGGTPVGAPLVGLVPDALGARFTLGLGGGVSLITALALSVWFASRTRGGVRGPARAPVTSSTGTPVRPRRQRRPDL